MSTWRRNSWRKTRGVRALAFTVLVLLASATAGRGYCPMRSLASTARDSADVHHCCQNGLTGAEPACCHARIQSSTATLLRGGAPVLVPAGAVAAAFVPSEATAAGVPATFVLAAHSPPPRVLRI